MPYLSWKKITITDFSDQNINSLYNDGYVFTRVDKGVMDQTRSIRINLARFEPTSENRRVLRKTENILLQKFPLPYANYHYSIGKLGKDFYEHKFGSGVFSANKIKELMTDEKKSNFNLVLGYSISPSPCPLPRGEGTQQLLPPAGEDGDEGSQGIGYCIARETNDLLHYCYPFYNIQYPISNIGMSMMLKAIVWAKENDKKYIYLGSFQRPTDTYKLQFAGLEWFDGKKWQTELKELKQVLTNP